MKWTDIPINPTNRILRQFAAAWLVVFGAMALHQALVQHHVTAGWLLGATALLGVVGLVVPRMLRWIFVGATVLAFPLGWVVTQTALLIVFYVVITPLALLFRWRGRDHLRLGRRPRESYWVTRSEAADPGRYLKQF